MGEREGGKEREREWEKEREREREGREQSSPAVSSLPSNLHLSTNNKCKEYRDGFSTVPGC